MSEAAFTPISDEVPIEVSPRAIEMGKQKMSEADGPVLGIRVGIKGGGCSGLMYHFEFAEKVRENRDIVVEVDGVSHTLPVATIDIARLVPSGF